MREKMHNSSQQKELGPLVMAHRGGAGLWPENTLFAFERAARLGADVIETDVHGTADGVLVVIHDATVERTTNGKGLVREMTLAELKKLDAGYRWSADGMTTFPYRGQGLSVPTLEEVFTRMPGMRFNIEPKQQTPSLIEPLGRMIRKMGMADKIVVGSFSQLVLDEFRLECPEVSTSAGPEDVAGLLRTFKAGGGGGRNQNGMCAVQVPEYYGGVHVLTTGLIAAAHSENLQVHAWTVNETSDMRRLIEAGVDGIITDYPDRLMALLGRTPQGSPSV
jgi:glycerophosphoryl diester phosphodiesterase